MNSQTNEHLTIYEKANTFLLPDMLIADRMPVKEYRDRTSNGKVVGNWCWTKLRTYAVDQKENKNKCEGLGVVNNMNVSFNSDDKIEDDLLLLYDRDLINGERTHHPY